MHTSAMSLSLMQKCVGLIDNSTGKDANQCSANPDGLEWLICYCYYCLVWDFYFGFFPLLFSSKNEVFGEIFSIAMLASIA